MIEPGNAAAQVAPVHARATELIAALELSPHPEGGHFREIYRSAFTVDPHDGRAPRAALTVIYFLLTAGEISRWHRVRSDEVWQYIEGDPLELEQADAGFEGATTIILGANGDSAAPVHVIRAGQWQAARTTGAYTLVSCTVGPGFEYSDFEMLHDVPSEVEALKSKAPRLARFR